MFKHRSEPLKVPLISHGSIKQEPVENYYNERQEIATKSITKSTRCERKFVPMDKKDSSYLSKRTKNNESARKSRSKRKTLESYMEKRLVKLITENHYLRAELKLLQDVFRPINSELDNSDNTTISYELESTTDISVNKISNHLQNEKNPNLNFRPTCIPLKFRHKTYASTLCNRD